MALVDQLTAVALDALAVALLGWTTRTALRRRERPSARPFAALLATLTLWAAFELGSELPGTADGTALSTVFEFGQIASVLVVPGVWLVYALGYTGRGTGLSRRRIAVLGGIAFPIVAVGVVIAAGPPTAVVEYVAASMFGTEILYLLVLFSYATYLLVGLGRSHARVSHVQIGLLTAGVAAPFVASVVGSGGAAADGVTLGLLASGGLLTVAVRRYPVMTGFPRADYVARTRVVESLQEAVVVLDWDDHVLDANEMTAQLFDRPVASMVGDPIGSAVTGLAESDLSAGTTETVFLETTAGRRLFQYSVSAVDETRSGDDEETAPVARAVLLRDVTDRQTREQRLTVLNRVLRHNVRNELDVLLAYADRIDDADVRSQIRDSATDLIALSDQARDAEEVMTASADAPDPVDLTAVASTVVERYRTANPDSDVSLTCPESLTISSHRVVIRQVLSELVDNAIEHAEGSSASVEVGVRTGADAAAVLSVADDGPGIPDRERSILAEGTETQLEHGRGLGLWFVNWAVTQLGGDLEFADDDPDGSVVTVRLHGSEYAA